MRNVLVLAALLLASIGSLAGIRRPEAGITVDRTFSIKLSTEVSSPCVALPAGSVEILLSYGRLTELADVALPPDGHPSSKDIWLRKSGATSVLEKVPSSWRLRLFSQKTPHGCFRLSEREGSYVFLSEIEAGFAAVWDSRVNGFLPVVSVRYKGDRCGDLCGEGFIQLLSPHSKEPLASFEWWIS